MTFIKSTINTTSPTVVGCLTVNARNASSIFAKPFKPTKAVYYIEDITISGPGAEVEFMLNDSWLTSTINIQDLKIFIGNTGLNRYCFDSSDFGGDHVQYSGFLEIDEYLSENLNSVVIAYLKAGKIGQYHVN